MNSRQEQKLIDYKNQLKEEADYFYSDSSINENLKEQKYELLMSEKLEKIADEIEKIIYENKI